tara:strand:- start:238 stop:1494 length:1257 start_codon:yes stop_codon:yes gene_type:complete
MTRKIKKLIKDFSISSFNYSGGMQGGGGVSEEMLTTKGDTHGYTTENARVPIGVDGQILTADSTQALGLGWATAGGGIEYSQITTPTTFTPTQQTGLVKVTVDGTDMTGGDIDIIVDSVVTKKLIPTEFDNRVLNPTTNLSFVSNNGGYNLVTASYDSVSLTVSGQDAQMEGIVFSTDGTKMYTCGRQNDRVYQYSLSTAWDLSTASYDSVFLSVGAQDPNPHAIAFKSDGTKMYMIGTQYNDVFQYSLSTAWDLSTASYDSVAFAQAQDTSTLGMTFKSDGTKMYILGGSNDSVFQYSLSTAWDMSTASYDSISFSVASEETNPQSIIFNSTGTKMFIVGTINDSVFQYSLSTAWDLSTAIYDSISFSVAAQNNVPLSVKFNSDGTKMYVLGSAGSDTIYQYSTVDSFAGTARISIG